MVHRRGQGRPGLTRRQPRIRTLRNRCNHRASAGGGVPPDAPRQPDRSRRATANIPQHRPTLPHPDRSTRSTRPTHERDTHPPVTQLGAGADSAPVEAVIGEATVQTSKACHDRHSIRSRARCGLLLTGLTLLLGTRKLWGSVGCLLVRSATMPEPRYSRRTSSGASRKSSERRQAMSACLPFTRRAVRKGQ